MASALDASAVQPTTGEATKARRESATKLLVGVTGAIEAFLNQKLPELEDVEVPTQRVLVDVGGGKSKVQKGVDLDEFIRAVGIWNSANPDASIPIYSLMADANIVKRIAAEKNGEQEKLSEMDQMKIRAEERRYQRTVQGIGFIGAIDRRRQKKQEDVLANSRTSLAMAVNNLLGLFLMFGAGYWMAALAGATQTAKMMAGTVATVTTLVVEVLLLVLYDYKRTEAARDGSKKTEVGSKLDPGFSRRKSAHDIAASRAAARSALGQVAVDSLHAINVPPKKLAVTGREVELVSIAGGAKGKGKASKVYATEIAKCSDDSNVDDDDDKDPRRDREEFGVREETTTRTADSEEEDEEASRQQHEKREEEDGVEVRPESLHPSSPPSSKEPAESGSETQSSTADGALVTGSSFQPTSTEGGAARRRR